MISEEIVRRERLAALRAAGTDPYPPTAKRQNLIGQILADFETLEKSAEPLAVGGRIRALRKHGGITFLRLEDASGEIQIMIHRDTMGETGYNDFHATIDVADFLEVSGVAFTTQKGERSIKVEAMKLLSKSLLPLPEKWHGLTDVEKRYRHRYLDLLANPLVKENAKTRSRLVSAMRHFLDDEGFLEVETPILQPIAGGANAKPFVTHHNTLGVDLFLRIAPELYLKRLVVGGFEKIYEFARCFRNEGISPQHNPEFTQVELYWAYATVEDLMNHLEKMMSVVIPKATGSAQVKHGDGELNFAAPLPRHTFRDIVLEHSGIDLEAIETEDALRAEMKKLGVDDRGIVGYGDLVDELYKDRVRPKIIQPTFVTDYPAEMKPLAKRRSPGSRWSASAQLVVAGMEVWNAFNELNDPLEQEARFMEQEALRERGSEDAQRIDHDYIKALKHGMPPTAGYGLGIDRFAALLTDSPNLKEVILFPTLKPEAIENESEL